MKKKREDEKEERWKEVNKSKKNVSGPSNPPDELAQNVSKKNPFQTNYSSIFSAKVQNLAVFSFIYMIRIRFFGPQELIQNGFRAERYAVVKQAENFRVRELVKKIESHPHRQALQADLQQSNAYNPFSDESKAMIREMGILELLELCETTPKVQCSECFLHWNQGIVYCTCWHLLRDASSRRIRRWQLDSSLNPELCHQEEATSWPPIWEDERTKRPSYFP